MAIPAKIPELFAPRSRLISFNLYWHTRPGADHSEPK